MTQKMRYAIKFSDGSYYGGFREATVSDLWPACHFWSTMAAEAAQDWIEDAHGERGKVIAIAILEIPDPA